MQFSLKDSHGGIVIPAFQKVDANTLNYAFNIGINNGTLTYQDGSSSKTYTGIETGVWHDYKIVMDSVYQRYDIYIDGQIVVTGAGFQQKSYPDTFAIKSPWAEAGNEFYVDDMSLEKGTGGIQTGSSATTFAEENFEDGALTWPVEGPWCSGASATVVKDNSTDNSYAEVKINNLESWGGGEASIYLNNVPKDKDFTVESFSLKEDTGPILVNAIDKSVTTNNGILYNLTLNNGMLSYKDGTTVASIGGITAGSWHDFKIVIDNMNCVYDIYIDGLLSARRVKLEQAGKPDTFGIKSAWSQVGSIFDIDNIKIDTLAEPGDTIAPATTVSADGKTGKNLFNNANVTVVLKSDDGVNGTGVKETWYSINNGELKLYSSPIIIGNEGTNIISYYSVDNSGNKEETKALVICLDKTGPVVEAPEKLTLMQTDRLDLTIEATDLLSGVKDLIVSLDGTQVTNPIIMQPLTLQTGKHAINVSAVDTAGNITEKSFKLTVIIDIDHVDSLMKLGYDKRLIDSKGIFNDLMAAVKQIQSKEKKSEALNGLKVLENKVKAQSGKHINPGFADILLSDIKYLIGL